MTNVLRLQKQLDLSKKLTAPRKKKIKEALSLVMGELQAADNGK